MCGDYSAQREFSLKAAAYNGESMVVDTFFPFLAHVILLKVNDSYPTYVAGGSS